MKQKTPISKPVVSANARIKVTRTVGKKGKRKISASVVEEGEEQKQNQDLAVENSAVAAVIAVPFAVGAGNLVKQIAEEDDAKGTI